MTRCRLALTLALIGIAPITAFAEVSKSAEPKSSKGAGIWTRTNIDIPASPRADPEKLYPSGEFEPLGFSHLVLSFQGEAKKTQSGGRVGVLLVPEEDAILRAMKDGKQYQFAIELGLDVPEGERFFAAESIEMPVSFARYRVYFYNETGERVLVNLYAYLTR